MIVDLLMFCTKFSVKFASTKDLNLLLNCEILEIYI